MNDMGDTTSDKKIALDKLYDEQKKMSANFQKTMNKNSIKHNLFEGAVAGTVIGAMFGFMASQTFGKTPVKNEQSKSVVYKFDQANGMDAMIKIFAIMLLVVLGVYGIKTIEDAKRNKTWADILANDTIKRYFIPALGEYTPQMKAIPSLDKLQTRHINAIALILNNMPNFQINELRKMASNALVMDKNGIYSVHKDAVNAAIKIILDHVVSNNELGYNILRIMRGDEPLTYFLGGKSEKTR